MTNLGTPFRRRNRRRPRGLEGGGGEPVPCLRDWRSFPTLPGTCVPGYNLSPRCGWIFVAFVPLLSTESSSHPHAGSARRFRDSRGARSAALPRSYTLLTCSTRFSVSASHSHSGSPQVSCVSNAA